MHRVVAIIPARFNSTRFTGKPLAILKGKPLIQHVYEQVSHSSLIDTVFVATDDRRIYDAVTGFEGKAVMTSGRHVSGTDRIAEVVSGLECDFVVNIQGDEPFIRPEMINDVVKLLSGDERASIGTLAKRITDIKELLSPNVVKVVWDNEGFAMYFSRAPIPYHRDEWELQSQEQRAKSKEPRAKNQEQRAKKENIEDKKSQPLNFSTSQLLNFRCYKHIGIYGYRRDALLRFASMKQGKLEIIEKLEQLRAIASGMKIKVKETPHDTFGIDTIEDMGKAEEWLSLYS